MLTAEELEEYEYCTFFNKKEILHIHKRFVGHVYGDDKTKEQLPPSLNTTPVSMEKFLTLPELQYNPFVEQICKVFSSRGNGDLSFEDFLDMMSVFSETATRDVKASYAFRIYDYNNDGYLDKADLKRTVQTLCNPPSHQFNAQKNLQDHEVELVVDKILAEADLDGDKRLSFVEFDNIVARAPDFVNTFRIRI